MMNQLIDYCTYNEDGMDTQCNAEEIAGKHGGPNNSCLWEGIEDPSPFLGELDELPPCGKSCAPWIILLIGTLQVMNFAVLSYFEHYIVNFVLKLWT